jgi:hypothetical protein
MRRIFGSKRDEITGSGEDYIKRSFTLCIPHHILFGDQIKKIGTGKTCSTYGEKERCIQSFGGKTDGRRPLKRPRSGWKNNIKMDLGEEGWGHGLHRSGSG